MYDLIIVGAGPAGLTAAIYACRASRSVLVLEARAWGGQIINTPDIENYPARAHVSGFDFANDLYQQAVDLGAEIRLEKAVELRLRGDEKQVVTTQNVYACRAVILATGSENRKLGLAGEEALTGRGVSYCATCDGNFFRRKDVAVVGGGNTALEDALYLSDLCATVYLIHRREGFRADAGTVARLRGRQNVVFLLGCVVTRLNGAERLQSVEVRASDGSLRTIPVQGLFVAVGHVPENRNFGSVIDLDAAGYAVAGEDCRTKVPGVFVAGDNRTKAVRQLVTAAADGAVAATEAVRYLS